MENFNTFAVNFIKGLNELSYTKHSSYSTLEDAQFAINMMTGDSGFYAPKAIKIKDIEGIYFLRQDGSINYEVKMKEENGEFVVYEWTMDTFNKFEQMARVAA